MCQAGFPALPRSFEPMTEAPFINDCHTWPSSFCQRMSALPSWLKSPVRTTCQAGFPALPRSFEPMTEAPFISDCQTCPSSFCLILCDLDGKVIEGEGTVETTAFS